MWKHAKKFKGKQFQGRYSRESLTNERVFLLILWKTAKAYNSWQAAKKDGWIKL